MIVAGRRTALVTGGATGIGAAISERFLDDEWNVFVVQRTKEDARQGGRRLGDTHRGRVYVAAHDLAADGCADAVAECVARFGRLDALVNNASVTGAAAVSPLESLADEQIDRVIDTNLKAPLRLAREALPHLVEREGVIVNIGSIAAFQAQYHAAAYVASKAGLAGLTRALALDLADRGVRVVHVAPGDIATETSRQKAYVEERGATRRRKTPLLRRAGRPEEVAAVVAWVVSEEASYITGTTILVDGGLAAY